MTDTEYTEDELNMYSAWTDYRSEYGASGAKAHEAFCLGWTVARKDGDVSERNSVDFQAGFEAAKGTLDIGGVQR
jgi:hypothetical protein